MNKSFMRKSDAAAMQNKLKQQKERLVDDAIQFKAPRSFIISQGTIVSKLKQLVLDLRRVMEPFTASKLEEKKSNTLKDFLSMASFFHVTHLVAFSETALDTPYMRICRLPQGPTLSFKIHSFSLMKDINRMFKRNTAVSNEYVHAPLVMLNGFPSQEPHTQLMTTMFQNMFPTISVKTLKLSECKRVVMFNYDKETKIVQMRHYVIVVNNAGVNRAVKKVAKTRKSVNMRKFTNAADFILTGGLGAVSSDSELDEAGIATVAPQRLSGSIQENSTVNVRLREVGPRIDLELVKIQDGFFDGKVIFHAYSVRTPAEEAAASLRKQQEKSLKERRRFEQEENVKRKLAKKKASKTKGDGEKEDSDAEGEGEEADEITDLPEIDDIEYYRREVGEEPDEDFLRMAQKNYSNPILENKDKKFKDSEARESNSKGSKSKDSKSKDSKSKDSKSKEMKSKDFKSKNSKKTKSHSDDGPKKKKAKH